MARLARHLQVIPLKFCAYQFTVEGSGIFPVNMLTHEVCLPRTNDFSTVAFFLHSGYRRIELIAFRPEGTDFAPLFEVWKNYGWEVNRQSIQIVPE